MSVDVKVATERAEARIGSVIKDKWRLDRLLGVGGMACVYAATHRNKKRAAGLKAAIEPREKQLTRTDGSKNAELFLELKELRKQLADARDVPAYVIFTDFTLLELARERPTTKEAMLQISGVGRKKLEQYGDAFLELLKRGAR